MQTSSNLLFFFQSYLKQQIEVPWIFLTKLSHLGKFKVARCFSQGSGKFTVAHPFSYKLYVTQ